MRRYGTLYAIVYVLMLLVSFVLPFFSSEGYSIRENSLSELGAQETPYSWVMNIIFMLLSIVTVFLATKVLKRYWLPLYLLYFFAAAFFFTGVYRHAPIHKLFYLEGEHLAHTVFSAIAGTSFCVYGIVISFYLKDKFEKVSAIVSCALVAGLSLAMLEFPTYRGILQRLLFILAFGWLFYSLVTFTFGRTYKPISYEK
ncbi:MAG: DUF998 domain-containing protein [Bacteroidota bacterium]